MNNGWVSLHRSILDWEWYEDANTVRLFIHCLLKANHEPKVWRNIAIDKGQFYTSLDSLSSELGLSAKQIRVSLDKLKRTGSVASSQHARGRMITVAKYEEYQDKGRLNDSQKAGLGQAEGRVGAATNNYNNNNNKIITNTPDKPKYEDCDYEFAKSAFEEIQKVNPNHKQPNLESWAKDVRKMREIDKRDLTEMANVWMWIRSDSFWSTNCLSISKFREKYDQLKMKSQGASNEINQRPTTARPDNSAAGRVRQNVAEGIAAKRAEIDQIRRDRTAMATDVIDVRPQMDERLR